MSLPELSYEKVWTSAEDFPTYEGSEEQVRADNQYHPDAIKDYLNNVLLPALSGRGSGDGAVNIGLFPVEGLAEAQTVQDAIELLLKLLQGITQGAIPDYSITGRKLTDESVTEGKLAPDSVGAGKLKDGCVTTAKIADGALTSDKFAEKCVSENAIQDGAVTSEKLASSSVTASKLADKTVSMGKLGEDVSVNEFLKLGPMILSPFQFVQELPETGVEGLLLFKEVI